jgi:hypothetical protein
VAMPVKDQELKLLCGNDPVVKMIFIVTVTLTFELMTPTINRILTLPQSKDRSSLVKIKYTKLKLSCGNDPVVKNYIYSSGDLDI